MSLTITSLVVLVAGLLGFGDLFTEGEVTEVVNAVIQIVGVFGVWYGRYRQGDVDILGRKF